MFRLDEALKVYLHREPIDFRLNINGLALLVEKALGLDPLAPCAYVFSNRRRNRMKILGWDRNGYWLLLKRLEQDRWAMSRSLLNAAGWRLLLGDATRPCVRHRRRCRTWLSIQPARASCRGVRAAF